MNAAKTTRSSLRSAAGIVAVGIVAVTMAVASAAFACTRSAYIQARPAQGPAGSSTTVSGNAFYDDVVEIHWNTATGPLLASTRGPSFSVSVTIPTTAAPGVYYLVAVGRDDATHMTTGRASASFTVTKVAQTGTTSDTGPGQTDGSTSGADEQTTAAPDAASSTASSRSSSNASSPAAPGQSPSAEPVPAPAASAVTEAGPTPPSQVSSSPAGRRSASTESSTASSAPTPATPAQGQRDDAPTAVDAAQATVSGRTAASDLWSGFATSQSRLAGPSLDQPATSSTATNPLAVGVGMLSLGLVAMVSGMGVAQRRRRVAAVATRS